MMAMSFMLTAYCNRAAGGRGPPPIATICHDLPAPRLDPSPGVARFAALNHLKARRAIRTGVNLMSAHTEVRSWLPQLFNWLAVVVLISLGVLI
jgi:hypothetical protein